MKAKGIKVSKNQAQVTKQLLTEHGLISSHLKPMTEKNNLIFPVTDCSKALKIINSSFSGECVEADFRERKVKPMNLKHALEEKIPTELQDKIPSAFDTLGNVAIIEIPPELCEFEEEIGQAIISVNNSIESVFKKTGAHKGIYREEPVKLIAGKPTDKAEYKESKCVFEISLGKVFFSPRLGTERLRISKLIKKGEKVAALFAGVGPFPVVFAKNSEMDKAIAIELNPVAVEDMKRNIERNCVGNKVEAVLGDVNELSAKFGGEFDRAVMPLPKSGEDFLESAIKYIKASGGVVHYYQFVDRAEPYKVPLEQISRATNNLGVFFKVLNKRKVRDYSPDSIQIVVDFWVEKH